MSTESLSEAIQYIKDGNKRAALPLLTEHLKLNSNDEKGWSWLYVCVEEKGEKIYCLKQILRIRPDNIKAKEALLKLEGILKKDATLDKDLFFGTTAQQGDGLSKNSIEIGKPQNKWWIWLLVGIFVLFLGTMLGLLLSNSSRFTQIPVIQRFNSISQEAAVMNDIKKFYYACESGDYATVEEYSTDSYIGKGTFWGYCGVFYFCDQIVGINSIVGNTAYIDGLNTSEDSDLEPSECIVQLYKIDGIWKVNDYEW
jgi:hypothetical protein